MGVPTPAPGVGTFRSPHPGPPPAPERGERPPLPSVRGAPGRAQWGGNPRTKSDTLVITADLTNSAAGVNSPRPPRSHADTGGEQSPGPWPTIRRGDDVGVEGGTGAVGPCDEKPRTEAAPAPPVAREQSGHDQPGPASQTPSNQTPSQQPDPEHPDPRRIATQPDFGRELTRARQRAGLTVREVARAVGIPASTAGDYFAGRHLPPPSQPGLLPRILRVCGETDPEPAQRVDEHAQPDPPRARPAAGRRRGALPGPGQFPARGRPVVLRPGRSHRPPGRAGHRRPPRPGCR